MPTPVSVARRCLTEEAARVLDDAVSVTRRRSHAQTTSLHAVSALLALPSSLLREACARARSSAYLPRLQFRALELSVGVALDRLPSARSAEEPPVANSLMAAIKRSQANQRRQPENFQLQQIHAAQQNASVLKVELKHFVLSILDDPIVSRVLGEAGFRSCDIKMAIAHPPVTHSSRFARNRFPPIFLCNLTDSDASGARSFRFPFAGVEDGEDENSKRIGEILIRKTTKNPLLVGVGAIDALRSFTDCIQKRKSSNLPPEISGLCVFDISKEVSGFVLEGMRKETMSLKIKELVSAVEHCSGPGIIINIGEIKVLVSGSDLPSDEVSFVVSELKSLLKLHEGKLWLIGAAGTDADLKFLGQCPTVEKDLDLHLLVITWKPPTQRLYSKSSLMGSFVPFGGFFSSPSDFKNPVSSTNPSFTCCHLCSEKFEQEKASVLKAGSAISVADRHSASLPSWLQMAELDTAKAKDGETSLSTQILELQKKWNAICQRVHPIQRYSKFDAFPVCSQPSVDEGFRVLGDGTQSSSKDSSRDDQSSHEQEISLSRQNTLTQAVSEASNVNFQCKLAEVPKTRHIDVESPSYHSSVATDLSLGTRHASKNQDHPVEFKSLREILTEKVGRQEEAINAISQAMSRCRTGNAIWLTFLGPDRDGKRRIAAALAEAMFGSKDSLISVDVGSEDVSGESNSVFEEINGNDTKWGRTIVDSIALELRKRPNSVIFLQNVDKADLLARSSITHAIRTGKFSDSHGRETSISNSIFVTTISNTKDSSDFSEERVLRAKSREMEIVVESISCDTSKTSNNVRKRKFLNATDSQNRVKKSPRSGFDLNLPLDQIVDDNSYTDSETDTVSETSEAWLENFLDQVDEKVTFKPFDFDALAASLLTQIRLHFQTTIGSDPQLEIDHQVMLQILAACWLSESNTAMEKWVEQVLSSSFMEARKRYNFSSQSVLRLVACEGLSVKKRAVGICLPTKIKLN